MSSTQPQRRTAVCTIVSKNYLAYARTLMNSVREVQPDWERFVLLVDEPEGYFDPAREQSRIVRLSEIGLPEQQKFLFRYNLLEVNTAVKPWMLEWMFQATGADQVIYLDPDICVYHPLSAVTDSLDRGALMVLTPHLTKEMNDGMLPGERNILQAGCYNLGFLALARHPDLPRFLAWWRRKLEFDCRIDLAEGLFVDQRWMDLAPGLFPNVEILRHPGYNVAYWNLAQRPVRLQGGKPWIGTLPLAFFHFSGLNPNAPDEFSKHQNRFRRKTLGAAGELVDAYCHAALNNGYQECRRWPYAFGSLHDGTPIPDLLRRYYRNHPTVQQRTGTDPFRHEHAYLNESWAGHSVALVTRLMRLLWEARPDLQAAYPNLRGRDAESFARQYVAELAADAGIAEKYVAPVRDALRGLEVEGDRLSAAHTSELRLYSERDDESGRPEHAHPATPVARILARLAVCCLPLPRDRKRLRRLFQKMRPWGRFLPEALRHDLKRDLLHWLNRRHAQARPWGLRQLLTGLVRRLRRLWPVVAQHSTTNEAIEPANNANSLRLYQPEPMVAHGGKPGFNLVGYLQAPTGVGESARLAEGAATAAGLSFTLHDVTGGSPRAAHGLHDVNVLHVNADQMPIIREALGAGFFAGRYNIGYWHWELPEFPDRWRRSFALVDEIWAPSRFIQDAVSAKSPRPVVRIPHGIAFQTNPETTRASFGLPRDSFLFLMMFDTESFQPRKNPEGAIEAFRAAFAGSRDVTLVVKVNHRDKHPAGMARLKSLVAGLPNVILLDKTLSRQEVYDLHGLCDCYVSLHRSEGFGLGPAEAMYLGKPVIATGWSGNMDFMTAENSCPVNYRLVRLAETIGPYDKGQQWAEPDLDHAAYFMKKVVDEPNWREEVGARGRATIRSEYSPESVGRLYRQRLEEILRHKSGDRMPRRAAA